MLYRVTDVVGVLSTPPLVIAISGISVNVELGSSSVVIAL